MSKNQKGTSFSLPEDVSILEVLGMWEDESMTNEDIDKALYGKVKIINLHLGKLVNNDIT